MANHKIVAQKQYPEQPEPPTPPPARILNDFANGGFNYWTAFNLGFGFACLVCTLMFEFLHVC